MIKSRKVLLMVSAGNCTKIPLYAGDLIFVSGKSARPFYTWRPMAPNGKNYDLSRKKYKKTGDRHLHKKYYEILIKGFCLEKIDEGTFRVLGEIQEPPIEKQSKITGSKEEPVNKPGKRRPLLKLPDRGLPPRWC